MRYDQFRDSWHAALGAVSLLTPHDRPAETIDLVTSGREWQVTGILFPQLAEPFHVSATVGFRWDPFESARSYTTEEDLLTEVLGSGRRGARTTQRLVRVDVTFNAALPHGTTAPLPAADTWAAWVRSTEARIDEQLLAPRRQARIPAWRGDLEIRAQTGPQGTIVLTRVSVPAFDMVIVPRLSEAPRRQDAGHPRLDELARRFRRGFDAWMASVAELGGWLRETPVPATRHRQGRSAGRKPDPRTH